MNQHCHIGELEVLVMGKALPIHKIPYYEKEVIAKSLLVELEANIANNFELSAQFEIIAIYDGCIKVNLKTTLLVGTTISAIVVGYRCLSR